ncbi:hypothetical protein [uncultured Bdellovibrio sp.]|uniref:hypothetical protein n=1 Tax=Bdellovibrio sp. HCB-162 TaxID=3394234 RepID=UPI0025F562CF|nr:hypothetical protein [uncultured Bdellovibrio sp.]
MMKIVRFIFLIVALLSLKSPAYAGKVESVQDVMKKQCSKHVSHQQALSLIRPLYLTCIPGTLVSVDEKCKVQCLKSNAGAVIGR